MTALLALFLILALCGAKFADVDPVEAAKSLAKSGIDAIFGGAAQVSASASVARGPGVVLKYSTMQAFVAEADLNGRSVGDLFAAKAGDLGGYNADADNLTFRDTHPSEGGVIEGDETAQVGRTYVASIAKEDKGN